MDSKGFLMMSIDEIVPLMDEVASMVGGIGKHADAIYMAQAYLKASRRPIETISRLEAEMRALADEVERLTVERTRDGLVADIDRSYLAKLAGNLRGACGHADVTLAADAIESLVKVIDGLQADAIRDPKIEELEAEVVNLRADVKEAREFQKEAASLRVERDALRRDLEAWSAWTAKRIRPEDGGPSLGAEDARAFLDGWLDDLVSRGERLRIANAELDLTLSGALRERDALRAERDDLKRRIARWEPCGTCRRERDEAKAEAGRLRRACENRSEAYRQQSELLDRHVAEKNRLCEAAGIMMLGNPAAGAAAIAEAIEAENDAEALAGPAFNALDSGDVETAKKALAQMEDDVRLRGTQAYARLSTMISLHMTNVEGDSEALTTWRKWAVERASIGEDDALDLEDETLRIAVADRWEVEAQVWRDAHGHADAAFKGAAAQRDFYRARLHAEIEAHSLRAAKEKP